MTFPPDAPPRETGGFIRGLYRRFRRRLAMKGGPAATALYLYAERLRRAGTGWHYSFVRLEEMLAWGVHWASSLKADYDLIVGVPRSGLLVANIISVKLGRPLAAPDMLLSGACWHGGKKGVMPEKPRLLLVDDSIHSGGTMAAAVEAVRKALPRASIETAALIAAPGSEKLVDHYFTVVKIPRLFEWNMLHVRKGSLVCDLDGVICENCPPGTDADERLYTAWVKNARPYLIPAFEVDCVLSARLEKYRADTEAWLAAHGVRYRDLVLWDLQDRSERRGKFSIYKIERIKSIKPEMVWESNAGQAEDIYRATGIPTLCVDTMTMRG